MNIKKLLMSSLLMLGFVSASAQEPEVKTVYDFNPHWYVQIQPLGGQYTLGEVATDKLLSYNAQLAIGYQFHHALGLRLAVNAWQSKGGSDFSWDDANERLYTWKWKYVSPTLDLTVNLSDLFCGFNPKRVFNFSVLGGIGANIGFDNDEAGEVKAQLETTKAKGGVYTLAELRSLGYSPNPPLSLYWDGTKVNFVGRFGAAFDFRLSDRVSAGLEGTANFLSDHYNSKPAGNADWYFNVNAGVKIALGKTYTTRTVTDQPRVVERVVEKVVEKPVYIEKPAEPAAVAAKEPLRRDIFFTINSTVITPAEKQKVEEVVAYMKKYPEAKVSVTGYADKGTGNASINARLGKNRAKTVVDTLVQQYGIDASRITSDSKGDTVQPFAENDKNRVSICIAE